MSDNTRGGARPEERPLDPVVIDLTYPKDYVMTVNALEEVEAEMKGRSEGEQQRIAHNDLPESESAAGYWSAQADRAPKLIDDIERQLDANAKARRGE